MIHVPIMKRLARINLGSIPGMVVIQTVAATNLKPQFHTMHDGETGKYIDSSRFSNVFAYAASVIDPLHGPYSAAIVFDPQSEECPPCLRACDGIVHSENWKLYAIARFEFEQAEKDRSENQRHEKAKERLVTDFCESLREIGVPAKEHSVELLLMDFVDGLSPHIVPGYLPVFEIDGMAFIYQVGDGVRVVGLLEKPSDATTAASMVGEYKYKSRVITTPADLGAALAMRGEGTE